jgi:sialate O-acetylesterase
MKKGSKPETGNDSEKGGNKPSDQQDKNQSTPADNQSNSDSTDGEKQDSNDQQQKPSKTGPSDSPQKGSNEKNPGDTSSEPEGDREPADNSPNAKKREADGTEQGTAQNHHEEIADAKLPSIRVFKVDRSTARTPQTNLEGHWVVCSPETAGEFSAVGYFFARELHLKLKRPIGLLQAALGGANCEAWISQGALRSDDDFARILVRSDQANADPAQANNPNRASVLYNGMIAPLLSYPIKGAIWYQGESNAARAFQYRKLFPALIGDWRRAWGQGDFPFLFVQLANYKSDKSKPDQLIVPEESAWAELREAQAKTLAVPNTGMAVTIDLGDPNDINPKNKKPVGSRLALSAFQIAYGQDVIASGPVYKSMKVVGKEIHLDFLHLGGGLAVHGDALSGFAIAGADKKFVWATARIDDNRVVVTSTDIEQPIAARYAWGDNPDCNLFNKAGLPAVPFRTDEWPGVTHQAR